MSKKCEICGNFFHQQSGKFSNHLLNDHNLSLKDYIIQYELNGMTPKCQCGYCEEDAPFFRGKFLDRIGDHQKYKWIEEQYIKKYGRPVCETCGKDVKFRRGVPNIYCSPECFPNRWNQEKKDITVKEKYKVERISQLDSIKDKISNSKKILYKNNKKEIVDKFKSTCLERFGFDDPFKSPVIKNKCKDTMFERYGVDHPSKTLEFRDNASKRMVRNNSEFDFTDCYKIKKYKDTELTYQSSYEYDFLEYCEKNNILDRVENGNIYNFLPEELDYGFRTITDFCIGNIEIEIKSTYILEKQGGYEVIDIKRKAVESAGKQYLLILDKDYSELQKIINLI